VSATSKAVQRGEHELLLLCVRPNVGAENVDRIRTLVSGEVDWEYLFLLARRHAVVALMYFRLQEVAADLVPATQLQRLQKYFQENAARNVLLTAELCRLIKLLAASGIEAIPYKGPALALFAYNNLALRRFVDLDVMVRKEDVTPAIELLLAEGYELSRSLTANQLRVLLRTQHNVQFRRDNRRLIVELHWEVAAHLFAPSVSADELWQGLVEIDINGVPAKSLSADDLIFSLSVHGSRHVWEGLLWICDIAWLATRHELHWAVLLERAKSTSNERMFLLGLHLAAKLLHVSFPPSVVTRIQSDPSLDQLAEVVAEGLFGGVEPKRLTSIQRLRFNLILRETWLGRARYFRHLLDPTDRDLGSIPLPRPLSFGYYLKRPFRLIFKGDEGVHNTQARSKNRSL
jgi:putative nucleotidyltransferase-like protein